MVTRILDVWTLVRQLADIHYVIQDQLAIFEHSDEVEAGDLSEEPNIVSFSVAAGYVETTTYLSRVALLQSLKAFLSASTTWRIFLLMELSLVRILA